MNWFITTAGLLGIFLLGVLVGAALLLCLVSYWDRAVDGRIPETSVDHETVEVA